MPMCSLSIILGLWIQSQLLLLLKNSMVKHNSLYFLIQTAESFNLCFWACTININAATVGSSIQSLQSRSQLHCNIRLGCKWKAHQYIWGQGKPMARISANINRLSAFRYTPPPACWLKGEAEISTESPLQKAEIWTINLPGPVHLS
jgi:hypothetical protein